MGDRRGVCCVGSVPDDVPDISAYPVLQRISHGGVPVSLRARIIVVELEVTSVGGIAHLNSFVALVLLFSKHILLEASGPYSVLVLRYSSGFDDVNYCLHC